LAQMMSAVAQTGHDSFAMRSSITGEAMHFPV
jgi:hypothetical protein